MFKRRRSHRFLISPYTPNAYDERMVEGLALGIRKIGHEALVAPYSATDAEIAALCAQHSIDVVFQVNRCRQVEPELPKGVRHIGWFQDPVMPSDISQRVRGDDILYFIVEGDDFSPPSYCKTGYLATGVRDDALSWPRSVQTADFSFCGYIPPPLYRDTEGSGLPPSWPDEAPAMAAIVEQCYVPLRGELNINRLAATISKEMNGTAPDEAVIKVFAREYPRLLDRAQLIRTASKVSKSIELYGTYWDWHGEFREFYKCVLHEQDHLYRVFQNSKINLANNTHGLGLHSRTLECMASGGFIMVHSSRADERPGGIKTSFAPGVHYAEYTPDTLGDEARRWLKEPTQRLTIALRAEQEIRRGHLWCHRAQQIVTDLA